MGSDPKIVRILLVGDAGCGKTSIILALVGEEFPLYVPPRAEEITIPADVTPEKVPTHIVDYSSQEQNEEALMEEIVKSHVVCVVYSLIDEAAIEKLTTYWLPLIKHCTEGPQLKPVILAGNKADLPYDMDAQSEKLSKLLEEYTQVETGIECSAKELLNVSELFYFAQKAVLHPTAPLYSPNSEQLKPDCEEALKRIFRISDSNNDGILDDNELNEFQIRCFNAPLQPQALQDVKNVVMKNMTNGVLDNGLTMEGFVFLHQLFIQRGRHETTWKVLRKFGYSNDLSLKEEYLQPPFEPKRDCEVELSSSGMKFLKDIFKKYDKDEDGALSSAEQQDMHSVCPKYPWDEQRVSTTVETNKNGWVTLDGFLAFWILQTSVDYLHTLQYLAMMGYPCLVNANLTTAIEEIQPNDKRKSVFQCKLFGSRRSGKSTIVRGLVGKQDTVPMAQDEEEIEAVAIKALPSAGRQVHLILHEAPLVTDMKVLNESLEHVNVVGLLYDLSALDSFRFTADLYTSLENVTNTQLPCVFVATHNDLPQVEQNYHTQPEQFIEQHGLMPAKRISNKSLDSFHLLYTQLLSVARDPSRGNCSTPSFPSWLKYVGVGLTICVGIGTISYLLRRPPLPTANT